MSTAISKHNCVGMRLEKFMPENGNCITLVIGTGNGYAENLSINLFGFSDKKAAILIAAVKEIEAMGDVE